MCKTITVDGERKGVRGDKCGKPTSNSLSFSITKSVATKHPVDVTSPHIARGCQPMLQLHYRRRSDGWTARYAMSMVGCVWEVEGWADRVRAGASPSSPLSSPTTPPPARRRITGCQEPEHGWTTRYAAALTDRRRLTAHEDATAVLRTIPHCN